MSFGSATDKDQKRFSLAPGMTGTQLPAAVQRLQLGFQAASPSEDGLDAAAVPIEWRQRDDEADATKRRCATTTRTTITVAPL